MDFRKDATIRPNCFTTAQPLCLPRPSNLFFTAMIFVFAIFVLISLVENQLCFRVSVYAMSFVTSPFFHIGSRSICWSAVHRAFHHADMTFKKFTINQWVKNAGATHEKVCCAKIAWATRANYRGRVDQKSEKSSETRCGDARVLRRIIYRRPKCFDWDLLVLPWSSYSYFDQLRTHKSSAEEFRVWV